MADYDIDNHETLMTVYNCSHRKSVQEQYQSDFAESIFAFTPLTWFVAIVSIISIGIITRIHLKFNNYSKHTSNSWILFRHIVRQYRLPHINMNTSVIATIINVYCFLVVVCYFSNGIKSDKISTYQPRVYDHFKDIPDDENIEIIFPIRKKRFKEDIHFRYGPDSKIRKIEAPFKRYMVDWSLKELNLERIIAELSINLIHLRNKACKLQNQYAVRNNTLNDICFYMADGAFNGTSIVLSMMMSNNFTYKPEYQEYNKYLKRSIQSGIFWYQHRFNSDLIDQITPDTADCMSKYVVIHPPENTAFELSNYKYSMIALLVPLTLALLALHFETFRKERFQNPVFSFGIRSRKKSDQIFYIRKKSLVQLKAKEFERKSRLNVIYEISEM